MLDIFWQSVSYQTVKMLYLSILTRLKVESLPGDESGVPLQGSQGAGPGAQGQLVPGHCVQVLLLCSEHTDTGHKMSDSRAESVFFALELCPLASLQVILN